MKVVAVALALALVVLVWSPAAAQRPDKKARKAMKNFWNRFGKNNWKACVTTKAERKAFLRNPCTCEERVTCDEEGYITNIDFSDMGLKRKNLHPWILNQLIKANPRLGMINLRYNSEIGPDEECVRIPMCVKEERSVSVTCLVDPEICDLERPPTPSPTDMPTPAPTPLSDVQEPVWDDFYAGTGGSSWKIGSSTFAAFPCIDKPNGRVRETDTKMVQCSNGGVQDLILKNNDLSGSYDPAALEPFMMTDEFQTADLSNNPELTWTGCLDAKHTIFSPYGPKDASNVLGIAKCDVPAVAGSEEEAFQALFDATDGANWNACKNKYNDYQGCGRLEFDDNDQITEVDFSDMGFPDDVPALAFEILRFARALPNLEEIDLSENDVCFTEHYKSLLGCGDTVECEFAEACAWA